jgi:hypothetical protein
MEDNREVVVTDDGRPKMMAATADDAAEGSSLGGVGGAASGATVHNDSRNGNGCPVPSSGGRGDLPNRNYYKGNSSSNSNSNNSRSRGYQTSERRPHTSSSTDGGEGAERPQRCYGGDDGDRRAGTLAFFSSHEAAS